MLKLRKMLGDIASPKCTGPMRVIETRSRKTLCAWAAGYARRFYLPIYEACCPQDTRLGKLLQRCADYGSSEEKPAVFVLLSGKRERLQGPWTILWRRRRRGQFPQPAAWLQRRPMRWAFCFTALPLRPIIMQGFGTFGTGV